MKKITKKIAALLLTALMLVSLLPATAFAGNWNPSDVITITVRVFDENTGNAYVIGTDTVQKGDQYVQSVDYTIPALSYFTSNTYGRITQVVGNWVPSSGSSKNVGSVIEWDCDSSTATMTYWVTYYRTGSGSGSGANSQNTENLGSGSKAWTQYIVYHSNYPDGTDYTYQVTYNIQSYVTTANHNLKTISQCGFSVPDGYKAAARVWNTEKGGTGSDYADGWNYPFSQTDKDKTIHLYAQWEPSGGTVVTPVTLIYKDGSETYAEYSMFAGDTVNVIGCDIAKDGYSFLGWSSDSSATSADYKAGSTFVIQTNTTLYAVWEKQAVPVTYTLKYDAGLGTGAPEAESADSDTGSAAFTISSTVPSRDGYTFLGWADTEDASAVTYMAGDELTLQADAPEKTVYAVWQKNPATYALKFVGAAIRVPDTHYHDYTYEENLACGGLDKTNLRFGYNITLPDDVGMDDIEWYWDWGIAEDALDNRVEGKEWIASGDNTFRSNLVITNIPIETDYSTMIYARLTMIYTDEDGNEITLTDNVQKRSVKFVATAIQNAVNNGNSTETDRVKKYVEDLLKRVENLTK